MNEKWDTANDEQQERYLRLAADLDNFKKRARQELLEANRYAPAALARLLLPVLDDAERAMEHVPEGTDEVWARGLYLVLQKLREALAAVGVERIEALGHPFDPRLHEAVGFEETANHQDGTVIQELQPGYRLHDRVLRPALVKVARSRPPSEPPDEEAAAPV
jgi:molecular chaperone GrpE